MIAYVMWQCVPYGRTYVFSKDLLYSSTYGIDTLMLPFPNIASGVVKEYIVGATISIR